MMKELRLSFDLPSPWVEKRFETDHIGAINYLVGPNGSGKSRFAEQLRAQLPQSRILGTDRLSGMQKNYGMGIFGDTLSTA